MKKVFVFCLLVAVNSYGQKKNIKQAPSISAATELSGLKESTLKFLDASYLKDKQTALQIWDYAELGYKETKSAALHVQNLKDAGFTVETGVAGIPTAFVATYGSGSPVIGILAEYDALPGLAQEAIAEKKSIEGKVGGHGCGHHLFGTASVSAGIAIKKLIEEKKISGTIKVYGCPAEEGGSGKVYMVREGLFNNVDAVIHWHPDDENKVYMTSFIANKSAKFKFYGISSHAAMSPENGRSSLDAVEAMNNMANMMREHIPQETRIHYVITNGGKAPNVVPDYAEVYYYIRHPKREVTVDVFDRITKAAEGAALGTGTTMQYEIVGGTHDLLINKTLASLMQENLEKVGGVVYTEEEKAFGKKLQASFFNKAPAIEEASTIKPLQKETNAGGGSSDVSDVSYVVPTVGLEAATWIPGTSAHSWQAVASGGTEIGTKGMLVASKTMALTAIDLFSKPAVIVKAKEEFIKSVGDYKYKPLLGDRKPALNYRD
ncbi:amidohydrolase [Sediminibacterium sp.]|uniref:amidohydrolase n=1 Tax=Sediminibacterium sp. TaxID=1917865 RepID=UPI003F701D95